MRPDFSFPRLTLTEAIVAIISPVIGLLGFAWSLHTSQPWLPDFGNDWNPPYIREGRLQLYSELWRPFCATLAVSGVGLVRWLRDPRGVRDPRTFLIHLALAWPSLTMISWFWPLICYFTPVWVAWVGVFVAIIAFLQFIIERGHPGVVATLLLNLFWVYLSSSYMASWYALFMD